MQVRRMSACGDVRGEWDKIVWMMIRTWRPETNHGDVSVSVKCALSVLIYFLKSDAMALKRSRSLPMELKTDWGIL
jgi:hypothetical protein